jgi:hypothetical protein
MSLVMSHLQVQQKVLAESEPVAAVPETQSHIFQAGTDLYVKP